MEGFAVHSLEIGTIAMFGPFRLVIVVAPCGGGRNARCGVDAAVGIAGRLSLPTRLSIVVGARHRTKTEFRIAFLPLVKDTVPTWWRLFVETPNDIDRLALIGA